MAYFEQLYQSCLIFAQHAQHLALLENKKKDLCHGFFRATLSGFFYFCAARPTPCPPRKQKSKTLSWIFSSDSIRLVLFLRNTPNTLPSYACVT